MIRPRPWWTRLARSVKRLLTGNPRRDDYDRSVTQDISVLTARVPQSPPARGEAMTTHPRRER